MEGMPDMPTKEAAAEKRRGIRPSTPIEYQDTLICGKSQLLMKLQIFLSTNDGTTSIFVIQKSNDIKSKA